MEKSPSPNTDELWSYIRKHLNKTNTLIQNLSIFVNEGGVKKFDCLSEASYQILADWMSKKFEDGPTKTRAPIY